MYRGYTYPDTFSPRILSDVYGRPAPIGMLLFKSPSHRHDVLKVVLKTTEYIYKIYNMTVILSYFNLCLA